MAKKQKIGTVVQVAPQTVRVRVDRMLRHPLYEKQYRSTRNFLAHVADGTKVSVGDLVTIEEIRPVSKRKAWQVMNVTGHTPVLLETE